MLKIGFWTEEPRLIFDAEEPRDLVRLGDAMRAVASGADVKLPGPDGFALVGIGFLQIASGPARAIINDNSIIVTLPPVLIAEMSKKVERMPSITEPCHNYIDLEGLTIVVALGEHRLPI